ncbi:hypothetical protein [Bacillus siamensis]
MLGILLIIGFKTRITAV